MCIIKSKSPIRPLLLIILFFLSSCLFGQKLNISIDQIHEIKDLSVDNHIKCLSKDSAGNLWIGADNGLYRYNGRQVDRIDIPFVKGLLLSQSGELLVLADDGLFAINTTIFDWEINQLIKGTQYISDSTISYPKTIYQDIENTIWIAENENIVRYKDRQAKRFPLTNQSIGNYLRHSFRFEEDGYGNLWAMGFSGLLFRYDRMSEQFVEVNIPLKIYEASELASDGKDKLWIGTYDGVFEAQIDDTYQIKNIRQISNLSKIASMTVLGDYFFVASFENGLFQVNASNYDTQKINTFENSDVQDMEIDGNQIWVASSEGIFVINATSFYPFPETLNQFVPTIHQAEDNSFLINLGREFYQVRRTPEGPSFDRLFTTDNQLWSNDALLHKEKLWLATSEGVMVYDLKKENLITIDGSTKSAWLNNIFRTSDGTIWVSSQEEGPIIRIDPQGNVSSFEDLEKVQFVDENENTVYFLGNDGAFFIQNSESPLKHITLPFSQPNPNINDVAFSADSMYLATNRGIFVLAKSQIQSENISIRQINNDQVESIVLDKNGVIWFSDVKGLNRLDNSEQLSFNRSHGLPSKYIIRRGLLIDHTNQLWICTAKGLATLKTDFGDAHQTPQPAIVGCFNNNEGIPVRDYDLGSFMYNTNISLDILALTYPTNSVKYQTKLTRNGRVVEQKTSEGLVSFFDLPTGNYELSIKAKQTGANWSQPVIYTFQISKEWYQTIWVKILMVLGFLGLIYWGIQVYNRNLWKANEKLEKLVQDRTATLEAQKNELIQNQQQIVAQQKELISKNEVLSETQKALSNSEIQFLELKREQLRRELDVKTKQLTTHALSILQKNQFLLEISKALDELGKNKDEKAITKSVKGISKKIQNSIKQNDRWEEFRLYFEQVHGDFYAKLKISFPELTNNDLKQCALVKLNLSLEDSATLLGVSSESVRISRYRIQKKMKMSSQAAFYEYLVKL